jgi:hypothetical protein
MPLTVTGAIPTVVERPYRAHQLRVTFQVTRGLHRDTSLSRNCDNKAAIPARDVGWGRRAARTRRQRNVPMGVIFGLTY